MEIIEKRKYPRATTSFPLRLGALRSAKVEDVSRAGVRCLVSEPVAPMTVVGLLLEIPVEGEEGDSYYEIPCKGVVVRCDAVPGEGEEPRYEAAILFQDLTPEASRFLETWVNAHLSSPAD